ncbi:hypothetical protein [Photorhabdus heterorhabditis]|uniref:Uncharacterized protein n=2 Tax=Photorhabdus heterorhabditis TaxID=880156 RepID=A0A5B0WJM4_9GAMM|nr:hypothetical protein [Photorhabdus heterorhabditis]KAA1186425.1 hypothetical protein F0L16_13915 [Photorhabdus heterorhabditis]
MPERFAWSLLPVQSVNKCNNRITSESEIMRTANSRLKQALLATLLTFVSYPILATSEPQKMLVATEQREPTSDTVPNIIDLSFSWGDGKWLVNQARRPVIRTHLDKINYVNLINISRHAVLTIVIPKIDFKVIAKNKTLLDNPVEISSDEAGKSLLWLEPLSSLTISFSNNLAETPLQAVVALTKNEPDALAIFGPKSLDSFSFSIPETDKALRSTEQLGLNEKKPPVITKNIKTLKTDIQTARLSPSYTYHVISAGKVTHMEFSSEVYVTGRNTMVGGSGYWTREMVFYPGEKMEINVPHRMTLRMNDD